MSGGYASELHLKSHIKVSDWSSHVSSSPTRLDLIVCWWSPLHTRDHAIERPVSHDETVDVTTSILMKTKHDAIH